jgi:hypothetical protein
MKKTALQQAIIEIAELWSSPSDQPSYTQVFDVLKSKLPVEGQQIIDAYDQGSEAGYELAKNDDIYEGYKTKEAEQYYNETFS